MLRLPSRGLPRLLYVLGYGIEQVYLISERGQPAGINARPTAGIDDSRWRGAQMAQYQFASARLLELKPSAPKARGLVHVFVMLNNAPCRSVVNHHTNLAGAMPCCRGVAEHDIPIASRCGAPHLSRLRGCAA